ncbi:P-loop containing nucleoside triphosphate hydrolase protein [Dioscorea alata]|uniref:P-loop containing nucleoside triphosphate hydrolase protein n=1 Tax=Dioscorea alata TaxID=55571 RepID=A0ACB7TZL8_DIOAL|nr:P-loop containing nucleoside triphosphate hydrolase protein [Dioscorea alata]
MDFLSTIASVISYHAWDPIRRHSGYLISYKRNINKLVTKFDELDALRKDVQREVDAAILERLEDVKNVVQTWLMKVDRMEKEVKGIKEKASVISNKHFLHIGLHYKLGKEADNNIKTTDALLEDRNKFGRVSHKRPPPRTTDSLLYNEDFVIFDSRKSCVKKILEALKNETVHSIGLCGKAGVGKMMLVKDIAKQAKDQRLFGEAVMVTVSQNIDLKRIQTIMAESLGLHLSEVSEEVRAVKLAERLATTQNKILVILDDLWEALDLSKVGIQLSQMAATCKVVITTRNKDICEIMNCEEIVELETLSDDESWRLFTSRAGDAVKSPTMMELAQNIVKECAGLPLALVVLGTALKGKKLEIWKTVLMQLKRSMDVGLQGMSKQVFQSIKLSFDFLESEEAKSCFLHCCLYTEDYDIPKEELMHLMVGGGILIDDETLNDARGRVDLLLNQLKARGLLLQGSYENRVRIRDVVRDVAIQIGVVADHAFYVRAGQGLKEWPRTVESEMRNCRRLSLMRNDIEDLCPDPMQYPKLEMLILRGNEMLSNISETFFLHIGSLMVLDLSSTGIVSLPKSVSCLTNLRVLNLGFCDCLEDISHINGLKRLEILILDGCRMFIDPPKGVGWTQNLRFVNLNHSMNDYFSEELTRFHRLEQLFMDKFEGSFRELIINLRYLTHLFINEVVDLDDPLSHELGLPSSWPDRLVKFSLSFLKGQPWRHWYDSRRALKLMGSKPLAVWVKRLLKTTIQLALVEFQETELISIDWLSLSSLEYLEVGNWPNLTKLLGDELLMHEQIPLSQLKNMIIKNCPRLTNLIPSSLCQRSMQKLEYLDIDDCPMVLELFPCDQGAHNITELLPGLRTLFLRGLQSLQNVLQPFQCLPNLKNLFINDCGVTYVVSSEMETVVILADPFPALEDLDIRNCQEMNEMISPPTSLQAPCFFQRLRKLQIWSYLILQDLPQLTAFHHPTTPAMERLHLTCYEIEGCPKLQEPLEGLQSLQNVLQPLQCLQRLQIILQSLQSLNLRGIQTPQNVVQPFIHLPNLKNLFINDCGMRYVVSSEMETVAILADPFPALEDLNIRNCQEMSEMISPPTSLQAPCFFQRLRKLQIWSCPRLTHLFSYKQAISMQHLSSLHIYKCAKLEAVVISKEMEEEASSSTHVVDHESYNRPFPNLRELILRDLPQLTVFHHPTAPPMERLQLTSYEIEGCPKLQEPLEGLQSLQDVLQPLQCLQSLQNVLQSLQSLYLIGLQRLQNVLQPFQCLPNLKKLSIHDCGVRYVVSSKMETVAILADPFPALEDLNIRNCQEMNEMIFPPTSLQAPCFFQRLRELRIQYCPRLKHLFTYEQAICMQHLEGLYIRCCDVLEAVVISTENKEEASSSIHVANHESYNSPFPNLRDLILVNLPQLTAFHHPTAPLVEWLHLTSYEIEGCPKLQEPLEERIRSLRMEEEEDKGEEDEGEEEEAGDLEPDWYLEG